HQNDFSITEGQLATGLLRFYRLRGGDGRKIDRELRSLTEFTADIEKAAMVLDDAGHGGQSQARPLAHLLGSEERIENLVEDIDRDACARIGDREQYIGSGFGFDVHFGI